MWLLVAVGWVGLTGVSGSAQGAAAKAPAAVKQADAEMDGAEALIGRALFLRGFYSENDLSYDASGKVQGTPKTGDWTLAGMDVLQVQRRGAQVIELDGVRVAIRYNPDSHQFERHAQNDEKMKVRVADAGSAAGFEAALEVIFAQGIDPELQHAMPAMWQHYFNPGLGWPQDALTGQTIYALNGLPNQAKDVTPPSVLHKQDSKLTGEAEKDRVSGVLQLRMVVDAQGVPQRIEVARPLGYGLDERAVEAIARWRFTPAMRGGQPVAAAMLLNYSFEVAAPPRR
ncbi:TonB family protein [Granulicella arctica]|uniref:TonB family protein n=1 Tax=Granulicella arctica TaxID=940613 RepID=A0A7Y9PG48_9BACT|nr:TonB family protein [Granulicella arctica]